MKKSVSVQTMFKLTNNLKTITKQKFLTQRQSNGEPEQEIPGKFRLHFCKLAGSKNAEKNVLTDIHLF